MSPNSWNNETDKKTTTPQAKNKANQTKQDSKESFEKARKKKEEGPSLTM